MLGIFGGSLSLNAAAATEQRCLDLGANCVCSEPFDTETWATHTAGYADPDDSPDSTECKGETQDGGAWFPETLITVVDEVDMPPGNTVNLVWRNENTTTGAAVVFGQYPPGGIRDSVRRLCIRHYFRHSADFEHHENLCEGDKQLNFGSSLLTGDGGSANSWNFNVIGYQYNNGNGNIPISGLVTYDHCKDNWCRVEICESGNISLGTELYVEGYIQQLQPGGDARMEWTRTLIGSGTVQPNGELFFIVNMYRQGICAGTWDISHAMQAQWDTDNGQFIGAASEIEPGTGSPPEEEPMPEDSLPEDPVPEEATQSGHSKGGCSCSSASAPQSTSFSWIWLFLVLALVRRYQR